jgi:hypothetical protein
MGIRYLPGLSLSTTLRKSYTLDAELSLNAYTTADFYAFDDIVTDAKLKPYRLWLRLSTSQFEARLGLQKVNFGSALLLRPLMWFDRIDPRDPLQITEGVYGLLLRYYFVNNANIWVWGLYGNEDPKGWEFAPSDDRSIEYGGRFQYPVWTGEMAVSYHHRMVDMEKTLQDFIGSIPGGFPPFIPVDQKICSEDRFGFDGKLDVEIGLWFEGAIIHQDIDIFPFTYRRFMNLGGDYTFAIGNGLEVLTEYFQFKATKKAFGPGEKIDVSALSLNYSPGLLDRVTCILYYDWRNKDWYRFLRWERTYDKWSFYLTGFWNPDAFRLFQEQAGATFLGGKGIQLMAVFNH